MHQSLRFCFVLMVLTSASGVEARPQPPVVEELKHPKTSRPLTPQESQWRKALTLYGLGMLRVHEDRLVEATHVLEEALELDRESAAIQRALIPLYLALGRGDEALGACKKALDLDTNDYETWIIYARQLRHRGKLQEARDALARALRCQGADERLTIRLQVQHDLGSLCEETEQYDQALAAFAEVVKGFESAQAAVELERLSQEEIKQQAASTIEHMIKLCIQAKQYDRGLRLFAEAEPRYPVLGRRLNFHLARVHAAQGQPEKALTSLDAYLQTQPPGADAYEFRISLLRQLHREKEIVSSLRTFSERDSQNVALRLLLARQAALAHEWDDAEKIYQALAEESPTSEIYRGLFQAYHTEHPGSGMERVLGLVDDTLAKSRPPKGKEADLQAAAKARAMLSALREDAGLARALLPVAQKIVEQGRSLERQTQYFLAILAYRNRQLPQAEFFFRRSIDQNDDPQPEGALYSGLLEVLWSAHKYDAVVDVCRQGLRRAKSTNFPLFYERLPRALVLLDKTDEALAEADKGVESATEETRLMFKLLRLWVLGRAGRAEQALGEALALLKEHHRASEIRNIRIRLYELYTDAGDLSKAEEQLQIMLTDDPTDALVNNNLGYLWADQGKNLEEAERLIRKAVELAREQSRSLPLAEQEESGENAAYLDSLGWVLFRRGQVREARRWLERAAALPGGEDDPTVWDHLGDLYLQLEEPARARTAWQKALVLYEAEKRRKVDNHRNQVENKLKSLDENKHLGK